MNESLITLAAEPRQFIMHDAFEIVMISGLRSSSFIPQTNMRWMSSLAGTDKIAFFTPAMIYLSHPLYSSGVIFLYGLTFALVLKNLVDSRTKYTHNSFHGNPDGPTFSFRF
jgi:hypothetical protein